MYRDLEMNNLNTKISHVFEAKEKIVAENRKHIYLCLLVWTETSGNAVFKILLRSVDGALENMECL